MTELKKNTGFLTIFALLVTSLVGTGLFLAPAVGASFAGTGSIISWIIMFLLSIYIAMCFGELVARFPNAGGVYEFSKKAYGRFPSFIIGWITWLVNTVNTPLLIVAALRITFPALTSFYVILISMGTIIFMNYVAYRGMKDSAVLLYIFASITLVVISAFIFKAIPVFDSSIVLPLQTEGYFMIFIALFFISETFFGWENATFLAEETKNARVVIPKALLITTLIVGGLSVIVAILSLGIIPLNTLLTNPNAFSLILSKLFPGEFAKYFVIGIFITFIGSASGNIISSPRLLLAMARDKLFIEQFSSIHEKTGTPHKAIVFQCIVGMIIVFVSLGQYKTLLSIVIPLSLFMYIATIMTIPVLRKKYPGKIDFKSPLGNFLPYVVSLLFLIFIGVWLYFEPNSRYLFRYVLGFILFGLPVYLMLNIYYNPGFTIKINEVFSRINLWMENIFFPKKLRREIINLFSGYNGKKVLEFGAGVGTLTMFIADKVGPTGKIYAVDFSKKNIKILNDRMLKKGNFHVHIIHDEHIINRVYPQITGVDMIFSVGMLGYIQDLNKVLKEMRDILPDGGKICFIEYMDYFHFIPNPKYLTHKTMLQQIFKQCGFSVRIKKIKGVLWNYSLIYGMKHDDESSIPYI